MRGVDSATGKALSGIEHLKQSIRDILTTRIGSRIMRREYGSAIFSLIDSPVNRETQLDIIVAVIDALLKWEPRFFPQQVQIVSHTAGQIIVALTGLYVPDGKIITLDGLSIS